MRKVQELEVHMQLTWTRQFYSQRFFFKAFSEKTMMLNPLITYLELLCDYIVDMQSPTHGPSCLRLSLVFIYRANTSNSLMHGVVVSAEKRQN